MPKKIDSYSSHGQKLMSLFARLFFSHESHSLTDLARELRCSKPTVLRLVGMINRSYGIEIEETKDGRKKYYRIKRSPSSMLATNLSESELSTLQMCRAFTEQLLGKQLFDEAARALGKSQVLLPGGKTVSNKHFASFIPGSIDYTDHHQTIRRLIRAMEDKKVCEITYKSIMRKTAKTFYIKPLKIFSQKDTIYLHAKMAKYPGKPYKEPEYDPLLALHRIKKVEITDRPFVFPKEYDFEKIFNKNFGVIKEEAFEVQVEFSGFAAEYVAERIWSPDQKITKGKNGKIKLTFSASSVPEVVSWILSYGHEARLLKPAWLVESFCEEVCKMHDLIIVD